MKIIGSLLFALLFSVSLFSQDFEGKIVFKIDIKGDFSAQEKMMLPSEAVTFCKGDKTRTEMTMGFGMNTTSIADSKTGNSVALMNLLGSKYAIETKGDAENLENEKFSKNTKVDVTNETKTIAGYLCKKAIVKVTDPETKKTTEMDVWFAKDLNVNNGFAKGPFAKIEGTMLEFSLEQQGMNMNFQASSITKQKVDDQMFVVPEGYKKMTQEDLMKMMGGR